MSGISALRPSNDAPASNKGKVVISDDHLQDLIRVNNQNTEKIRNLETANAELQQIVQSLHEALKGAKADVKFHNKEIKKLQKQMGEVVLPMNESVKRHRKRIKEFMVFKKATEDQFTTIDDIVARLNAVEAKVDGGRNSCNNTNTPSVVRTPRTGAGLTYDPNNLFVVVEDNNQDENGLVTCHIDLIDRSKGGKKPEETTRSARSNGRESRESSCSPDEDSEPTGLAALANIRKDYGHVEKATSKKPRGPNRKEKEGKKASPRLGTSMKYVDRQKRKSPAHDEEKGTQKRCAKKKCYKNTRRQCKVCRLSVCASHSVLELYCKNYDKVQDACIIRNSHDEEARIPPELDDGEIGKVGRCSYMDDTMSKKCSRTSRARCRSCKRAMCKDHRNSAVFCDLHGNIDLVNARDNFIAHYNMSDQNRFFTPPNGRRSKRLASPPAPSSPAKKKKSGMESQSFGMYFASQDSPSLHFNDSSPADSPIPVYNSVEESSGNGSVVDLRFLATDVSYRLP